MKTVSELYTIEIFQKNPDQFKLSFPLEGNAEKEH